MLVTSDIFVSGHFAAYIKHTALFANYILIKLESESKSRLVMSDSL